MIKNRIVPIILFFGIILGLWGCKETPPFIDFSPKIEGLIDTTYVLSNVPSSEMKKIYIEDLTGVRCNNCPKAAQKIIDISTANPDMVVALGVYPSALANLTAPFDNADTFNIPEADEIFTNVYDNPSAIPTGGVNRTVFSGETTKNISYNKWSNYADGIKVQESAVILGLELKSYDDATRKARIIVKVTFTKKYDEPLNLSLYLSESKVKSKQIMPDGSLNSDYLHNHALRKAITTFNGINLKIDPQTTGMYEAGRVFEKEFEVYFKPKWVKDNCSIVALVNHFDNNSKEVEQASEYSFH